MQSKNLSHFDDSVSSVTSREYEPSTEAEPDKNSIIDNSSLTKTVLFVCDSCDGPLVPSSLCTVCRKTATRICVNCGITKKTSTHTICCDLILLGGMIKHMHDKATIL